MARSLDPRSCCSHMAAVPARGGAGLLERDESSIFLGRKSQPIDQSSGGESAIVCARIDHILCGLHNAPDTIPIYSSRELTEVLIRLFSVNRYG
jgi:hypothetical protein